MSSRMTQRILAAEWYFFSTVEDCAITHQCTLYKPLLYTVLDALRFSKGRHALRKCLKNVLAKNICANANIAHIDMI